MRGKEIEDKTADCVVGITPACAGKSAIILNICRCPIGSPPRMRGKAHLRTLVQLFQRITPACAGKRKVAQACNIPAKDHPRVCGEKNANRQTYVFREGSPPRVRGKVPCFEFKAVCIRITPACAGKSSGVKRLLR